MNRIGHFLFFAFYLALAAALWRHVLPQPRLLGAVQPEMLGLVVLAVGLGGHGLIAALSGLAARRGEQARLFQDLAETQEEQRRLEGELNHLKAAILDLRDEPRENVGRVVAEVKVLQSLIGELYNARTAEAAAGTGEPPPQSSQAAKAPDAGIPAAPTEATKIVTGLPLEPDQILDLVRDGLRENGVELALQPIVSLPQRKRRHFECFSRIRSRDGRIIVAEQYIEIAEQNGLITAIDNLLLLRCLQTLRRIRKGNANVSFFLNISPNTLADRGFFREFIGLMTQNADLAPALVFELPQRALRDSDVNLGRDLERLAQMGFRFSLDQVSDLGINVAQLAGAHFRFLKLDASRLLHAARDGLLGGDARQFKRILDSYGIDLIVERIETEPMLLELLDLHIDFGQGYLFGEPRFARSDSNLGAG